MPFKNPGPASAKKDAGSKDPINRHDRARLAMASALNSAEPAAQTQGRLRSASEAGSVRSVYAMPVHLDKENAQPPPEAGMERTVSMSGIPQVDEGVQSGNGANGEAPAASTPSPAVPTVEVGPAAEAGAGGGPGVAARGEAGAENANALKPEAPTKGDAKPDTKYVPLSRNSSVSGGNADAQTNCAAVGAYRDLLTGDVVETDQRGNTASPTEHPTIKQSTAGSRESPEGRLRSGSGASVVSKSSSERSAKRDEQATKESDESGPDNDADAEGQFAWPQDVSQQVTGFAVASSKRNADFHSLFPVVPEDDYLIESYGCALARDLLIHGRLYISESRVCFYSNIFGWVTNMVVPFGDIVSIEKRNTAYVIPNAILITTLQHKFLFNSLVTRDLTYSMLVNIWRLARPNPMPPAVEAEMGMDMNETDEDGDDKKGNSGDQSRRERLRRRLMLARQHIKRIKDAEGDASFEDADDDLADVEDEKELEVAPSKDAHPPTVCECAQRKEHFSNEVGDFTYPGTVEEVFNLFFQRDFINNFWQQSQHLTDTHIGEWTNDTSKAETPGTIEMRDVAYTKPLNASVGPKQTRCIMLEEKLHVDYDKYCSAMVITRTPDVPNGNSFCIRTRMCFTWANNNATRVLVTCTTDWTGRSMLRSIIDKASIEGQRQYYADLHTAVTQYIAEHPDQFEHPDAARMPTDNGPAESAVKDTPASTAQAPASAQRSSVSEMASAATGGVVTEMRPTVLVLGGLIVLLVFSHVWMWMRGTAAPMRDPENPHLLAPVRRSFWFSRYPDESSIRQTAQRIDAELENALTALERSRRLAQQLESDVRGLRAYAAQLREL